MERFSTSVERSLRTRRYAAVYARFASHGLACKPPHDLAQGLVHGGSRAWLGFCESSRAGGHTADFHRHSKERYRLSFFDEVDEPPRAEPRTPRTPSRARRPSGPRGPRGPRGPGGRRPSDDQQAIQLRRAIAIVVVIILIVVVALGVHSCQVSATNSALQDYTNSVSSLNQQSVANGKTLFTELAQASGAGNLTNVNNGINTILNNERRVYKKATEASVPDQVKTGNAFFLNALKMRVDGLFGISKDIQPALSSSATLASVNTLAADIARFYASDVVYIDYALPQIIGALHAAGTRFSPINHDQFLPNVAWTQPSFIAKELSVSVPGAQPTKATPGLHGHSLTSVSVDGTTLQTAATNTGHASPIPTFVFSFNNGGDNNEHNVKCKVSVNGTSVTGTATVAETFAHKNANCSVKLNGAPPAGTQNVVATVAPVLGEKNTKNNTLTYTVNFQ
jgi:hypothetical protein